MKTPDPFRFVFAAALLCFATSHAFAAETHSPVSELEIRIDTDQPKGQIMLSVFDSADAYGTGEAVQVGRVEVSGATSRLLIPDLPDGRYAIRAYHDVNGNNQLDRNLMGVPTEPFAFSNGAVVRFGPPSFDDAAFDLAAGSSVQTLVFKTEG